MARTAISNNTWTSLGTTSVDTLFGVEGGDVRLYVGTTTGVPKENGVLIQAGDNVVVPAGLAVSAMGENNNAVITMITFGS